MEKSRSMKVDKHSYSLLIKSVVLNKNTKVRQYRGLRSKKYKLISEGTSRQIMSGVFEEIRRRIEKGEVVYVPNFGKFWMEEASMKCLHRKEKGGKKDWFFVGSRVKFRMAERWFRRVNRNEELREETRLRFADKIQGGN